MYLLSKHPNIQQQIADEIAESRLTGGIEQNFEPVGNSTTLKGAIKEALRLYPVAPFLTRILPQNSVIGGFVVPAEVIFDDFLQ